MAAALMAGVARAAPARGLHLFAAASRRGGAGFGGVAAARAGGPWGSAVAGGWVPPLSAAAARCAAAPTPFSHAARCLATSAGAASKVPGTMAAAYERVGVSTGVPPPPDAPPPSVLTVVNWLGLAWRGGAFLAVFGLIYYLLPYDYMETLIKGLRPSPSAAPAVAVVPATPDAAAAAAGGGAPATATATATTAPPAST